MEPGSAYATFVVRVFPDDSGQLAGIVERVRTGEKATVRDGRKDRRGHRAHGRGRGPAGDTRIGGPSSSVTLIGGPRQKTAEPTNLQEFLDFAAGAGLGWTAQEKANGKPGADRKRVRSELPYVVAMEGRRHGARGSAVSSGMDEGRLGRAT
jgi:hypothetical protein